MSLFDFPRIHFSGQMDINVPTINNTVNFPLSLYDATHSKAFLPPRLYFSSSEIISSVNSPFKPEIHYDESNTYYYIEILPINTIPLIRSWCMIPIDVNDPNRPDAVYGPYYTAAATPANFANRGLPFLNHCPGYWNMYGDMGVTISNAQASGIQVFNGSSVITYTNTSPGLPDQIKSLLNTSFDLNTFPASGRTTALMVETVSNQSVYANIFCSRVNVFTTSQPDQVALGGKPFKFSAGIYGTWKVVNWIPAMASAGRFYSAIPLSEIDDVADSPVIQFFQSYKSYDPRPLRGVFVSFTIQDIFEYRYDPNQYANNNTNPFPAQAVTNITITPWYDGDMIAGVAGRNLISLTAQPIYNNLGLAPPHPVPISMNPALCSLRLTENSQAIFSIDLGTSWPELINPPFINGKFQPGKRGDASFETAPLGTFQIVAGNKIIGNIPVNPVDNPLKKLFTRGNLFDFVINDFDTIQILLNNLITVNLINNTGTIVALQETEYFITSDQKGPYGDQGEKPSDGFMVYSDTKEPIRLRIFNKGYPVKSPVPIGICQYIIPEGANDPFGPPAKISWPNLADGAVLDFGSIPMEVTNNAVYYFVYHGLYPDDKIPDFTNDSGSYTIMDTGSFICMRIYPFIDYSRYTDPDHPEYSPPTFEVVYEEIFKLYDVVYPIMALKHPFTKEEWNNGTMAGAVLQRTDPKLWNDILYMPRSRELSGSQRKLLQAWANNLLNTI